MITSEKVKLHVFVTSVLDRWEWEASFLTVGHLPFRRWGIVEMCLMNCTLLLACLWGGQTCRFIICGSSEYHLGRKAEFRLSVAYVFIRHPHSSALFYERFSDGCGVSFLRQQVG